MSNVPPPPPPPPPGGTPPPPMGGAPAMGGTGVSQWGTLASWGERVVAYLIDWVIVAVPGIVLLIVTLIMFAIATVLGILFYLVLFAYGLAASFYVSGYQ